ncbi:MAG: hypothetical protein IT462_12525 [Planctomycetes bacterium]|nr:hypothetical protein [Planctomycetota bacterium]
MVVPSHEAFREALAKAKSDSHRDTEAFRATDLLRQLDPNKQGLDSHPLRFQVREFLWDCVRKGFLVPVEVSDTGQYDTSSFRKTALCKQWLEAPNEDPFHKDTVERLRHDAPIFAVEPAEIYRLALRAHDAAIERAALLLLGLSAETMIGMIFETHADKTVKVSKAKGKRLRASDIQSDVESSLRNTELDHEIINEWNALASTYRAHRNACAHESDWTPDPGVVKGAFFTWPRFVRLTQQVSDALKQE